MRKIILLTAASVLGCGTAHAQMPYPKTPYSAESDVTAEGKVTPADMFISGPKIRMEMVADEGPAAGRDVVFVADRDTGDAFTLADMDGRKMAIKMDINKAMEQIDFANQELGDVVGRKWIGFKRCTNYKTLTGTTCLTKDNIVLEAYDDDRHMKVKNIKVGKQDPQLFEIPTGYQVMDLSGIMNGLGGFIGGNNKGSVGGINLGGLANMGSPADVGKVLSKEQNENGEGFNSIMRNLGLPTENIDTSGEAAFAKTLDGMIRNEVKGTNAEAIINGDIQSDPSFIEGTKMKNEMIEALENGEDPLAALMQRNGVSESELADFRKKGQEIEALNGPGGFVDQQIAKVDSGGFGDLESELAKLEALNAEGERLLETGQLTEEKRLDILRRSKEIEQRVFGAMQGK